MNTGHLFAISELLFFEPLQKSDKSAAVFIGLRKCSLCGKTLHELDKPDLEACGHTFCQKCTKADKGGLEEQDTVACPSCSMATIGLENQTTGHITCETKKSVIMDVEDIIRDQNGTGPTRRHMCTFCREDAIFATSFCRDCRVYMCRLCDHGHSQIRLFAKHDTRTVEDNHWQWAGAEGATAISPSLVNNFLKHENRDFFCPDVIFCEDCILSEKCPHAF